MSIGSPFGRVFGLTRQGIHHELLPPGRRTSWPHAEKTEEEFVNNTASDVRPLAVGDTNRADNQVHYPLHPKRNQEIAKSHWTDAPQRLLGEHDGLPDQLRGSVGPF